MNTAMTIAEVLDRSGGLSVSEAVAIVLSVIDCSAAVANDIHEPYGPPAPDNIELNRDGSIACTGSAATPVVSELAILLQALVARTPKIPGGLRYAIGRALLDVEAPPFDSVHEFAQSIARFEEGDRRMVLEALFNRCDNRVVSIATPRLVSTRPPTPPPQPPAPAAPAEPGDRRLHGPRSDQLRRELRAADELLYAQVFGVRDTDRPATAVEDDELPARRSQAVPMLAAAAVLLLIAGLFVPLRHHPVVPATHVAAGSSVLPSVVRPQSAGPMPSGTTAAPADVEEQPTDAGRDREPQPAAAAVANVSDVHPGSADDGSLVPTLDENQRPVFSPLFASNGSAVFFGPGAAVESAGQAGGSDGPEDQLRVMTIVDDGSRNYHVQLSPDGRRIAFDSDRDGDRGVYIANRDGSNVHRISGPGYAAVPTWSPDGRRIAFVRAEPGNPRVWNLWVLTLGAGPSERLTDYTYGQPWAASWFPDGRRIAYTHEDRLYVMDLRTRQTQSFATPVAGHLLRTPAVSPDGSQIVFQVSRNGVWLLNVADGAMRCVVQDPTAEQFAWAPDGRRVAFHSRRDGAWGVYVMAKRN